MTEPLDVSDAPEVTPEPDPAPKPPAIDPTPVPGAAGLPDDVKNGEVPGEEDATVTDRPPTMDE